MMKILDQLTVEANQNVNTARENIIRQFTMTKTKKRNRKKTSQKFKRTMTVLSKNFQVA